MKYTDYWDDVVNACKENTEQMGAFPGPRLTTVAAAEIVKLLLSRAGPLGTPYEGTMAGSVVQLHDLVDKRQTFVVSFSGYHPTLKLDLVKGARELREAFTDLNIPVVPAPRFWYQQSPPNYYVPLHAQTQSYFEKYLDGIDVTKTLVTYSAVKDYLDFASWQRDVFEGKQRTLTDITKTPISRNIGRKVITYDSFDAVYGQETGSFSYAYKGKAVRPTSKQLRTMFGTKTDHVGKGTYAVGDNFEQQKANILKVMRGMLASFLAIRMDLIKPADVPSSVKAARGLIRALKGTQVATWTKLAAYLEQVLVSPKLSPQQLDLEVTMETARNQGVTLIVPKTEPKLLFKRERRVLKKSAKFRHWKDVPTHRPQAAEFVTARNRLRKPLTSDLASARDDLVTELKDDELLSDILPHLWAASGGGPNGQFCAEPKAFEHVRTGHLIERGVDAGKSRVVVVGQLALWHSGGNAPREFSDSLRVIGPSNKRNTSASGGYMLPCSSCAARSGVMMDGLTLASQVIGTPKLFVSEDVQLHQRCAVCGKSTTLRCARCAAVFYCGQEHQRRDWARHKKLCRS